MEISELHWVYFMFMFIFNGIMGLIWNKSNFMNLFLKMIFLLISFSSFILFMDVGGYIIKMG